MAIRTSYDSKVNKMMNLKPIVLEIEKAMLHNEVHRFSDEILFVSDDFTEVPPFIHPIYSAEKDIAFIDVRGFSSVGQDGALKLKEDVDSELTLLRAKLELVWQRAPRADTFTAFHFSNTIFVRWLADTICHKNGLQLGQKSKVLAVTGLYNIGLYYNNITDEYQISKYAEMVSRDFYIPLEEVFSVIDTLDNPFPRDIDEYIDSLKQMQISPRLAGLNSVALYNMLGGSWFMTANAQQLVGLAIEYPPCFAAMVSVATRHRIFKKTQIGERVDRANKGGAYDQYARAINTIINDSLGNINPNRQRAGMESIPYNVINDDEFVEMFGDRLGMESLTTAQKATLIVGGGFIAAFLAWLWGKLSGGGSGGGSSGGGAAEKVKEAAASIEAGVKAVAAGEAENKVLAAEVKADAASNREAMNETLATDVANIVEGGADRKIEGIVSRSHNSMAIPVVNMAVKHPPSQEPTNHWTNMQALVQTVEHIEDPVKLAIIFEVYKRAMRDGDQVVKVVLNDLIKHPLFKESPYLAGALFCAGSLPRIQTDEACEFANTMVTSISPDTLGEFGDLAGMLHELGNASADDSITDEQLNNANRYNIEQVFNSMKSTMGWMIPAGHDTIEAISGVKDKVDSIWERKKFDTVQDFDNSNNYAKRLTFYMENASKASEDVKTFSTWIASMADFANSQNGRSRGWVLEMNEGNAWDRFDEGNREKLRLITQNVRYMIFYMTTALRLNTEMVNAVDRLLDLTQSIHLAVKKNLEVMKKELARAAKKVGTESYKDYDGEYLPAGSNVGMESALLADNFFARLGVAVVLGVFLEWVIRKITGGGSGGGGGGSRMSISWKVESAAEQLVRVGDKLTKTKADFLAFNTEVNRLRLSDAQLMDLVKTDADKVVLRRFLSAAPSDDHLLRLFLVLIVNGASGKDEGQFVFLGVSANDRDWDKWVLATIQNFRKVTTPNDMEFEKYLLFCGMSIPGTYLIADVIESIDITAAMNRIEVESEIIEEIFKEGENFSEADAKRIAAEIRKQGSGPASDSTDVALAGANKSYKDAFEEAAHTRYSIWPDSLFRSGLKPDERLADIKSEQWRTVLDTKRLESKLAADKTTLKRLENKVKAMSSRLEAGARNAKLDLIKSRTLDTAEDYKTISEFLSKKSVAMAEVQAYLKAVNAYTTGVSHQAVAMSAACNTLKERIGNVKTLLKKV